MLLGSVYHFLSLNSSDLSTVVRYEYGLGLLYRALVQANVLQH